MLTGYFKYLKSNFLEQLTSVNDHVSRSVFDSLFISLTKLTLNQQDANAHIKNRL